MRWRDSISRSGNIKVANFLYPYTVSLPYKIDFSLFSGVYVGRDIFFAVSFCESLIYKMPPDNFSARHFLC